MTKWENESQFRLLANQLGESACRIEGAESPEEKEAEAKIFWSAAHSIFRLVGLRNVRLSFVLFLYQVGIRGGNLAARTHLYDNLGTIIFLGLFLVGLPLWFFWITTDLLYAALAALTLTVGVVLVARFGNFLFMFSLVGFNRYLSAAPQQSLLRYLKHHELPPRLVFSANLLLDVPHIHLTVVELRPKDTSKPASAVLMISLPAVDYTCFLDGWLEEDFGTKEKQREPKLSSGSI